MDVLTDRFVCGLHNESTQKRLLTEDNLTSHRALEIAISMETAAKDTGELQGKSTEPCSKVTMLLIVGLRIKNVSNVTKRGTFIKDKRQKTKYGKKKVRKLHEVNETDSNSSQEDLACLDVYTLQDKEKKKGC